MVYVLIKLYIRLMFGAGEEAGKRDAHATAAMEWRGAYATQFERERRLKTVPGRVFLGVYGLERQTLGARQVRSSDD